ncbi:ATP-dependent DNA helicase RecG [bacterium]|nr:ATP-dependent DNA helicase RecG [bacterium]NDD83825.1 ATP-dependent DNA helicase RecG [bacterium]NDG29686.1 ATP-dependent DNA helicase RecG [bacterium]
MSTSLRYIKGVGQAQERLFAVLGVTTVEELIAYVPRAYNDYSDVQKIAQLKPGIVTLQVTFSNITARYVRRGLHITEALASDESGSVKIVWFNQPFRKTQLVANTQYFLSGEFGLSRQRMSIVSPVVERADNLPIHTARIVPIYRETKGLNSASIRKAVNAAFLQADRVSETLPQWLLDTYDLIPRHEALYAMHFPADVHDLAMAKHRLGFEEIFRLALASMLNKQEFAKQNALAVPFDSDFAKQCVGHIPFKLTDDQKKVLWRVFQDMERTHPMNRLIEGDVGSGKTIVAALAALMAMHAGYQVAYMAPTEILARQHAVSLQEVLAPLGYGDSVVLLTGSLKPAQKRQAHEALQQGSAKLAVGTHALITDKVAIHNLGLVIVDEQHRFGVDQRKKLQSKAKSMPHVLHMTATPIPRTLALTLYGELDISIIGVMPLGRLPIKTTIVSPNSRANMYKHVLQRLMLGEQVFVVCPLITESDMLQAPSAENVYKLMAKQFKDHSVGLLHGKLKADQKEAIMQQFIDGKLDILVATTVIEVGVNVPNATIMIIEGADRFGLAQMHQLRGRVGRSNQQGHCYVIPSDSKAPSARLRAFASTNNGFTLSELDLKLRGPGALYGTMQSGALDLRVATLSDTKLIAAARAGAEEFISKDENLLHYPVVAEHVSRIRTITNLN